MFRLIRYYAIASAVAIVVATLVLVGLYRQNAVAELIETSEDQNVALARSFTNIIWPRFSAYIASVEDTDGDVLRARPQTREIHQALAMITAGLPVLKVKIYNLGGLTVYSSEPSQIGDDKSKNQGFLISARDGLPASKLSFRDTFSAFSGMVANRDIVETYIPIRGSDGAIEGVFELYVDVTPLMTRVGQDTIKVVIGLLAVFGLLYGALSLIVRRADRILKRQHAELTRSKEMVEAHSAALEERFKAVVDNSPAKIHIKDTEGRYLLVNHLAEKLYGITDEEARGKTTSDLFSEKLSDGFLEHDRQVIETGHPIEREEEWTLDGRVLTYLTVKFPIFNGAGEIMAVGAIGTDITERKRAEDVLLAAKNQAEFANRAKSEFLANMSHELRTPLNAIIGFSEIIRTETFGPVGSAKYLEYVGDIHMSGVHLLALINDILDLSKIEAGESKLYEENIDASRTLRSCLTLVKDRAAEAGVEIVPDIAPNLPLLYADERKIKQILINLLSNAIKFTPAGGKVTVSIRCHGEEGYIFEIADNGIGISPEDIPIVLAPFRQVDSGLNRKYEGTGLGLPLTNALTMMHGGSLDIQSRIGVGTTVTVRFPTERIVSAEATGT